MNYRESPKYPNSQLNKIVSKLETFHLVASVMMACDHVQLGGGMGGGGGGG